MKISWVDTEEQRKSNRLAQVWRDLEGQLGSEMTTENLLNKLPQDIKTYFAWGTVSDARCSASVEKLGTEMEFRLTSSNAESGEGRKLTIFGSGMLEGSVRVEALEVIGCFKGDAKVNGHLIVRATGKVAGTLSYRSIEIDNGGVVQGSLDICPIGDPDRIEDQGAQLYSGTAAENSTGVSPARDPLESSQMAAGSRAMGNFTLADALTVAGGLLLSACVGDIEATRNLAVSGEGFSLQLAENYRELTLFEADQMYDWPDAWLFADKALAAARGEATAPEHIEDWHIPAHQVGVLGVARADLVSAIDAGFAEQSPIQAALAQSSFDCWIEQLEEGW